MPHPLYLFVSHSSLDNPRTKAVCDLVADAVLGERQIRVLVDLETLESGQPWPNQLHRMMAECHAAVMLLTANAVRSRWVLKEATILAWRLSLDPTFRLFVAQWPDVTDADLHRHGFGPLMLDQIHRVPATDAQGIAEEVTRLLAGPVPPETPLDKLVAELSILLDGVPEGRLRQVADTLHLQDPPWDAASDPKAQYLRAIAHRIVSEELGRYLGVDHLVSHLVRGADRQRIADILDFLIPFWVPAEAAGRLAIVCGTHRRAAAINGVARMSFTGDLYVKRAHPLLYETQFRVVPIPDDSPADIVEHVTREICAWYRNRTNRHGEPDERVVDRIARDRRTHYALIPPPIPEPDQIRELMKTFPTVCFVLGTDCNQQVDDRFAEVEVIQPDVDPDREDSQWDEYQEASRLLGL
jgi:hypothetical protein